MPDVGFPASLMGEVPRWRAPKPMSHATRKNVGVIVPSIGRAEHEIPAIMLALFDTARGGEELELRLRISHQAVGVIELESALDFKQFAAVVVR